MPAVAESAADPGLHRHGCGRRDCCSQPGAALAPGRVALAYGLPTAGALVAAGLAAALELPAVAAAAVVLLTLVLAGHLAGRVDGGRRPAAAAGRNAESTVDTFAKELPCP